MNEICANKKDIRIEFTIIDEENTLEKFKKKYEELKKLYEGESEDIALNGRVVLDGLKRTIELKTREIENLYSRVKSIDAQKNQTEEYK